MLSFRSRLTTTILYSLFTCPMHAAYPADANVLKISVLTIIITIVLVNLFFKIKIQEMLSNLLQLRRYKHNHW
jgi:hypothetical protein